MTPRRWMGLLGWTAGGYAALVGGAYALQRTFIYPAPRAAVEPVVRGGRLHEIQGSGRKVYALHVPAPDGAPTVVHFHGNGESLSDQAALVAELQSAGLGVFAVEYPGYGLARAASPSEGAIYEDADIALEFLQKTLGVPVERTVLQGQSLGTGVAVEMAARGRGARLVLIAPFTSMTDMVRKAAPFLPARFVVKDRYDNHEKAAAIRLPALIVHGDQDDIIPVAMGQRLATVFPNCRLYISPNSKHNDLFVVDGPRVLSCITAFAHGRDVP